MKISSVRVIPLGYMKDFPPIPRSFAIIRVETDSGIVGYGEASSSYGHSYPLVVKEIVEGVLSKVLIGKDPLDIATLTVEMQKYAWPYLGWGGVANAAIGAVEISLWDIRGKAEQLPICELLGKKVDHVSLYGTGTTYFEKPPEWHAEFMDRALERGFKAVKARVGHQPEWDLSLVRTLRNHIGSDINLMVDAYMTYSQAMAVAMIDAFEPYGIYFMEEPIALFRLDNLAELRQATETRIAIGERIFSKHRFEEIIKMKAADVIQPDVTIVGGIAAYQEVCALARKHAVELSPHIGGLSAIGIAANLHAACAHDNISFFEYDLGPYQPLRDVLIRDPLFSLERIESGFLQLPEGPGLGIDVDESKFEQYPYEPGLVYPDVYPDYGFNLN
jgi:L-alanine-DL-glutamate epimerase-like enolase superfamily enzyme